jgi:hypothetical protein
MKVMSKSVEYDVIKVEETPEFYINLGKKLSESNYSKIKDGVDSYTGRPIYEIKFKGITLNLNDLYRQFLRQYLIIKDRELITVVDEDVFKEIFVILKGE